MANKGRSEKDFFGNGYTHYDSKGKKIGRSEPNIFGGGYTNYDAKGKKVGRSEKNIFGGGYTSYDNKGNKIGRTEQNIFGGGYTSYDNKGNKVSRSDPQIFGAGYTHYDKNVKNVSGSDPQIFGKGDNNNSGGCYVATCVYGSYDCPEVWTLRRFRDNILAKNIFGRAFIKSYYAVSPTIVKIFGDTKWFKAMWKRPLDKMVEALKKKGFSDTSYNG